VLMLLLIAEFSFAAQWIRVCLPEAVTDEQSFIYNSVKRQESDYERVLRDNHSFLGQRVDVGFVWPLVVSEMEEESNCHHLRTRPRNTPHFVFLDCDCGCCSSGQIVEHVFRLADRIAEVEPWHFCPSSFFPSSLPSPIIFAY